MLITGCQSHETSADVSIPGQPHKAHGALTNAITTIVNKNPGVTYYELVLQVRVQRRCV